MLAPCALTQLGDLMGVVIVEVADRLVGEDERGIVDDPGPIAPACADAVRNGNRLLRTLKAASSKASATNGGTYQAMSKTNSRRIE
jgi:hypothetical protein